MNSKPCWKIRAMVSSHHGSASHSAVLLPSISVLRRSKADTICKPLKITNLASSFERMIWLPSAMRLGPANVVDPQSPLVIIALSVATWPSSTSRQPESVARLTSCNGTSWVRICFAILEFFGGVATAAAAMVRMNRHRICRRGRGWCRTCGTSTEAGKASSGGQRKKKGHASCASACAASRQPARGGAKQGRMRGVSRGHWERVVTMKREAGPLGLRSASFAKALRHGCVLRVPR